VIKVGAFKIETSFNVSNRGIVAVGQLIEGIPKVGSYISINFSGKNRIMKIMGIERGNPDEKGITKFGLLLQIDDKDLKNEIAENKLIDQVANIFQED
jgi:hypothetical protein